MPILDYFMCFVSRFILVFIGNDTGPFWFVPLGWVVCRDIISCFGAVVARRCASVW